MGSTPILKSKEADSPDSLLREEKPSKKQPREGEYFGGAGSLSHGKTSVKTAIIDY